MSKQIRKSGKKRKRITYNILQKKKLIIIVLAVILIPILLFGYILNINYKNKATDKELSNLFVSHYKHDSSIILEQSSYENLNDLFIQYQEILESLVDVYIVYEDAYINIFLSLFSRSKIDEWNESLRKADLELKKKKFQLAVLNTELERVFMNIPIEQKNDPIPLFLVEFSSFVNVQIDESDSLFELSEKKIKKEKDIGEDGYLGAHHVFERKKKQIAEQTALLFEKHNKRILFEGALVDNNNIYNNNPDNQIIEMQPLNASISLKIIRDYIFETVGWP